MPTPETATIKRKTPSVVADRDKAFAPLASWPRFKRLHAFRIDHTKTCKGPRDSQDARFTVIHIRLDSLDPTASSKAAQARTLIPDSILLVRDHIATCPYCGNKAVQRSLLVTLPTGADGELNRISREFSL